MSTTSVYTGFWADYNRSGVNRYQLLLDDYWIGIVTNSLSLLITTASGPIFELLIGPLSRLRRKISSRWNNDQQDQFEESRSFGDSMSYVLHNLRHIGGGYVNIPIHDPAAPKGTMAREAFGAEFERKAEAEAAFYAMNCYGASSNSDHCTKFYNRSISYPVGRHVDCPFVGNLSYLNLVFSCDSASGCNRNTGRYGGHGWDLTDTNS
ncbi:hypothetical protein B0J14DRAFT_636655 [Halenospora varia]|nr:hypothetical protein B0J14DRAFT_636655 [Halenospora varia]